MVVSSKLKPILSKDELFNLDYMKFVLTASASSTTYGVIKCLEKNNVVYPIRGNINALIISPFGTGKTSQMIRVSNVKVIRGNDLTFPGLIGTITREGQLVEGSCMRAGGKLLIIDEAQRMNNVVKNAMNSILDPPHTYTRTLGYKILQYVGKRSKYSWTKGSENSFTTYSKFSCIASSMFLRRRLPVEKAWNSRFLQIRMKITPEYMKKLLVGDIMFDINADTYKGNFKFDEYLDFHKYYWSEFEKSSLYKKYVNRPDDVGYVSRHFGDLIRLGAFCAAIDGRNVITFDDVKRMFDNYWKIMMYNFLLAPLTTEEYHILSNFGKTEEQLAADLGITQPAVSRTIKALVEKGLLISEEKYDYDKRVFNLEY